jgi:hypothetical protein
MVNSESIFVGTFFWQIRVLFHIHKQVNNINVQDCTFRDLKTALTGHLDASCFDHKQMYE